MGEPGEDLGFLVGLCPGCIDKICAAIKIPGPLKEQMQTRNCRIHTYKKRGEKNKTTEDMANEYLNVIQMKLVHAIQRDRQGLVSDCSGFKLLAREMPPGNWKFRIPTKCPLVKASKKIIRELGNSVHRGNRGSQSLKVVMEGICVHQFKTWRIFPLYMCHQQMKRNFLLG
ncbi:hypothetical protein Pint_03777 [Pistacia integerrima]|uniref:Uncharacterized protein n=1 Tax=Pistacia integerrima TaxID=434235 RepID=A0ACC0Z1N2_9ROSI|nr:hypothetical protein Pint_03777 [Pistacia integerrima]